jgi:hypothetical protein
MHVLNSFQQLIDIRLDTSLGQIVWPSFDRFIQVHLHYLKHKSQPACWLVVEDFN